MSFASPRSSRRLPIPTPVQRWGLLLGVLAFVAALLVEIPGLEPAGQRMLAIFLLAILLWVTEAIPLYATAALVILLEVLMLSDQALMATAGKLPPAASYFAALANPVIMLFLGGFLIADGAHKYRLDRSLAAVMLKARSGGYSPDQHTGVETGAAFWHMVDLVWMILFPLVYVMR